MRRPLAAALPLLLWTLLVHFLLTLPGGSLPKTGPLTAFLYNLGHAPLFAVWTLFALWALAGARPLSVVGTGHKIVSWLGGVLFACLEELAQRHLAGRSADLLDVATAAAGAFAALALVPFGRLPARRLGLALAGVLAASASAAAATWFERVS